MILVYCYSLKIYFLPFSHSTFSVNNVVHVFACPHSFQSWRKLKDTYVILITKKCGRMDNEGDEKNCLCQVKARKNISEERLTRKMFISLKLLTCYLFSEKGRTRQFTKY